MLQIWNIWQALEKKLYIRKKEDPSLFSINKIKIKKKVVDLPNLYRLSSLLGYKNVRKNEKKLLFCNGRILKIFFPLLFTVMANRIEHNVKKEKKKSKAQLTLRFLDSRFFFCKRNIPLFVQAINKMCDLDIQILSTGKFFPAALPVVPPLSSLDELPWDRLFPCCHNIQSSQCLSSNFSVIQFGVITLGIFQTVQKVNRDRMKKIKLWKSKTVKYEL